VTLAPGSHFALRLESHGQAPALIDGDRIVSYAELARLADAFAAGLTSDVRLLAIEMASRVEPIAAYLGALRAGVPVLLHGGGASARAILAACPPDATYEFREGADEPWALELQPRPWPQPPNPELGVLLSTSGSTGSGKLVRLSRSNLQANAHSIRTYLGITAAERAVTSLPLSYSYGLSVLNSHLLAGACVVLTEASVSDPAFR
jgi:long-subunit acyl-CoA synthetase (AMP-forming)